MRLSNNILDYATMANYLNLDPIGQLGGIKKLLAKGENGKFWAKDFDIKGSEMIGLAYLPIDIIKPTGVTVEVELSLTSWNWETQSEVPFTKKVIVKEWELLDYERLAKAYELIMALANL